jgi:hypothetical protein
LTKRTRRHGEEGKHAELEAARKHATEAQRSFLSNRLTTQISPDHAQLKDSIDQGQAMMKRFESSVKKLQTELSSAVKVR